MAYPPRCCVSCDRFPFYYGQRGPEIENRTHQINVNHRAYDRKISKKEALLQCLRSSRNASVLYHKILALPLLPPALIRNAFNEIRSKILLLDSAELFLRFLLYFEEQWLDEVGCKNFSVHKQKTSTTSAVEPYNVVLGRSCEINGHFFQLGPNIIRDESCAESAEKDDKIEEATRLLIEGCITVDTFLSRMVDEKNEICVDMIPEGHIFHGQRIEDESSEEETSKEESSKKDLVGDDIVLGTYTTENECVNCKDKMPNIVLLPCKHLKICDECNIKLKADAISRGVLNYNCPYCRKRVEDSMQVYT